MKEEKVRRLINSSIVTSTNVLRALFQKKILSYPERKFKNFLEDNLHYFFHLHQEREIRCCNCASSVFTIPKKNILPRVKFSEAYQKCGDPVEGHTMKDGTVIVQECLHSFKARDISLDDLNTESISVYLLHRGDLSKIELHALNVIQSSVERLHKILLRPILPFEFKLDDLEQAVVSLTSPHYYQPIVKAVFESIRELETEGTREIVAADIHEQRQHATSSDKELDTKADKRDEDAVQKITKLSQSIVPAMMNKISSLDHTHKRIRIETCKTVKVFENFTLNVQYQTIVDNSDSRILPSLGLGDLEVKWHFETPENWNTSKIIKKLKSKIYAISADPDIQINIKKISKGSMKILTTVDHNILRSKKKCESACETFLKRIVKEFKNQPSTASVTEMDVSVEIVHQGVAKQDDKGTTLTAVPITLAAMASYLAVRYHVDSLMMYPGNFTTFDGIFVDCIVDKRFQNHTLGKGFAKYDDRLVALTAQYKGMLRLQSKIQDYQDKDIPYKDVHEEMINQIIILDKKGKNLNFDDGMVCRFILSHSTKYDQEDLKDLRLALKDAVRVQAHSFAKVIAWKFTRLFEKRLSKKQYYDIWPGNICNCKEDSNIPSSLRFCSNHIVIVVEVFHIEDVNPRPNSFFDLPIAYRIVNGYSNEANLISKKIDQFDGKKEQLQTVKGLSKDIAEELFASHSKLCLISSSPIKSKKYGKSDRSKRCGKSNIEHIKQPCIQLFCREKRIIPAGEAHFPRSINSVPTDILEGYPRMLVHQVTIGSEVGPQNSRTGTLGGFVKFHGKDAFLTCAHVIVDRKYLVSNANRADIHENPISVYCKQPGGGEFPCGKLVSYVFPPEIYEGSSVDAAIIKLKSVSVGQVAIDTQGNCLPPEYLHKSYIDYQEIGTMHDIQIVAVGAVSSMQQGTDKLHLESRKQVEFETLTQAVKNQFIQNPDIDITGRIHYRDFERIIEEVGKGEQSIPRNVTLFNQISMRKIAFSPGDSGTCIYAKGHDDKFRCIGMAIASHPDGGCIITPIKPILSAFKLI